MGRDLGVWGRWFFLLQAFGSLYCQSQSLGHIDNSKSDSFPIRGCSFPGLPFVTGSALNFIDRWNQAIKGVGGLQIPSLLLQMIWSCWPQ